MAGMGEKIVWLAGAAIAYLLFCLYCAWRGARSGDKNLRGTAFALSAASLAGWMFVSHIGLVYRDGLPYAAIALTSIVLPLFALVFFERLGSVAANHSSHSLPELLGTHFESTLLRTFTAIIGLVFAIIILAALTRAGGALVNLLSDDVISPQQAIIGLTGLVLLYAGVGGMGGTLRAARLQYLLFVLALLLCSAITIYYLGSFERLQFGLSELARLDEAPGPSGESKYLSSPGLIQIFGSAREAIGSTWTGALTLTALIAMVGIFTSPIFLGWVLASPDPSKLARQQIWATAMLLGAILIIGAPLIGLGGHILGASMVMTEGSDDVVYNVMGANLGGMDLMETFGQQDELVPILISLTGDTLPWLFGMLAVCAIAALQTTAGAMLQGSAQLIANDLIPSAKPRRKLVVFGASVVAGTLALVLAFQEESGIAAYAHFALAISVQLLPALIAVCFAVRFSSTGITAGLAAGIGAVFLTEEASISLIGLTHWGGWPLTVHSAVWGLAANFGLTAIVSALTRKQNEFGTAHTADGPRVSLLHWTLAAAWLILGAGPGMVIGSTVFGTPADRSTWLFQIPSLWAWQILVWLMGILLLFLFARSARQASQT